MITPSTNDIYSDNFESKMDEYFTRSYVSNDYGRYGRLDQDSARSALATTRPLKAPKYWSTAVLGMRRTTGKP